MALTLTKSSVLLVIHVVGLFYTDDFFCGCNKILTVSLLQQVEMSPDEANRIFDLIDTNKSG